MNATSEWAAGEAARRRTFAVISHPDAGKSTLTEALALHAHAITSAGAVHGKSGRRGVASDWMEMEKARGISVTSAVLQFAYRDCVLNLLDTPGHADFSEDTYRVLAAVDCAVMLIDAAKGLEEQTRKLFDVCRHRGIPVITFINKWDRPGREALELLDEVEREFRLKPTPVNWPVGTAGYLRGLVDVREPERMLRYTRTPGGAHEAAEEVVPAERAAFEEGADWEQAVEELQLLEADGAGFDRASFLAGGSTPVFFGAAVSNIGVRLLLDAIVDLAPPPGARELEGGGSRPVDAPFSGLVFKVQANMDPAHRDRIAFLRVCSGVFERGATVTRAASGKPFATKYAHSVFGQDRSMVDTAYPGDVVGLVNAAALRVGDTLYGGPPALFPPMPTFAPEHFAVVRPVDISRSKQFRRGIAQLDEEGVVQVLVSDARGDQAPVLAAVGPMQFDVVSARMAGEFSAPVRLEVLPYHLARATDAAGADALNRSQLVKGEALTRIRDKAQLALFPDRWQANSFQRQFPDASLGTLLAAHE
ncbi:peptide chain release factor 3 [Streptomyces filamentosus]|uniref:Peptide chain release factor 3 n=2 Tax=Streptomyces filamentosus TaxID=67294 RepID=A0ABY4UNG8_STRFL|nr:MULTISPECIES: peptide chain release factor 3 [Streptomyces]MYR82900.1 peptide chain release factor 3 [Streptomyces sp. SID5466]EFE79066.1 peptide chain release factor 3:Small GTP-binding protein domain-containing protein [Streptomyces filamentosus NRRL 15998]ESU50748.1 peptide chain release factor 3 [Streptomyces sp. HCCB10043]EWS95922.1 peptide chain release factor 3 [Streptomyces filamentosus NRRL 11379]USC45667.1 peptide chain release factor 3 [Streptomyces filamentosus]